MMQLLDMGATMYRGLLKTWKRSSIYSVINIWTFSN